MWPCLHYDFKNISYKIHSTKQNHRHCSWTVINHHSSGGWVILLAGNHWLLCWKEADPSPNSLKTSRASSRELFAQVFWEAAVIIALCLGSGSCFCSVFLVSESGFWSMACSLLQLFIPYLGMIWGSWLWLLDRCLFLSTTDSGLFLTTSLASRLQLDQQLRPWLWLGLGFWLWIQVPDPKPNH